MWSAVFKTLTSWIGRLFIPILAWKAGRDSVKKASAEYENEILKRQRDNNVTNIADAISMHKKHDK